MIKSWQHKGIKAFYDTGIVEAIVPQHAKKLTMLLQLLNAAESPEMLKLKQLNAYQLIVRHYPDLSMAKLA